MANKKLIFSALLSSGLLFAGARLRNSNQFQEEVNGLLARSGSLAGKTFKYNQLEGLPEPVQRYFRHVLPEGQPYISYVRLKHAGQFKTDLKKNWTPITGEQYFTAENPGFVWQGKTSMFTATDKFVDGKGSLVVKLFTILKIVKARGNKFNQGELLRWLCESAWFPTNLLPSENLRWTPIDANNAHLAYTFRDLELSCKVHFNDIGEISSFQTLRYMGESRLENWIGRFSDYQRINGIAVPTKAEGAWILHGQEHPYARFEVTKLEYDRPELM